MAVLRILAGFLAVVPAFAETPALDNPPVRDTAACRRFRQLQVKVAEKPAPAVTP